MPYYTYDTSTIISRSITTLPNNLLLSAVVIAELMASAKDESQRKVYEALYRKYHSDATLIVPVAEDWLLASKILYWLSQGRRRTAKGRAQRLMPGASQRMALDALIATSARRWKATVITENWEDFRAIQRYCDVKVVKAPTFSSDGRVFTENKAFLPTSGQPARARSHLDCVSGRTLKSLTKCGRCLGLRPSETAGRSGLDGVAIFVTSDHFKQVLSKPRHGSPERGLASLNFFGI